MDWVFSAFVGAAVIHVLEEYGYPGGFTDWMKRFNPSFAPWITPRFAVVINGLFLVLCVAGAIAGRQSLLVGLSVASLLFFNGLIHLAGTIRGRHYAPGLVTGVLLYLPLASYTYYGLGRAGQLTLAMVLVSLVLGLLYQAVPIGYLGLSSLAKNISIREP